MCSVYLLVKQHSAFKWKEAIFGFLFPKVVQKIKYHLTAYSNISAKNYQSRSMFVDVIASQNSVQCIDIVVGLSLYI